MLILQAGSLFSFNRSLSTSHQRNHSSKHKKLRKIKRRKPHRKKKNSWRPFRLRRNHLYSKIQRSRKRKLFHRQRSKKQLQKNRFKRIQEDLSPDSISVHYAELKVRRMLARSELPVENRLHAFNKIMKTLDRYKKNGHVSIPDMDRIVLSEIQKS